MDSSRPGPPKGIQDYIYQLEEGLGKRFVKWIFLAFAGLGVAAIFFLTEARNYSNPEAMDMAQLARNLATGRGYTTRYIRPLAINLLGQKARLDGQPDTGLLRQPVPDLEHPPVYPLLLAAVFKVTPSVYHQSVGKGNPFTNRPPMEVILSAFNFGWLLLGAWLVYRLGLRLFEHAVGQLAALAFMGTEALWRFTTNGLATPLLLCLVLALVNALVSLEFLGRETPVSPLPGSSPPNFGRRFRLALGIGALLGIGCLTRYSFAWFLVPVLGFVMAWGGPRRWALVGIITATAVLLVTPWIVRNLRLTGVPFGTAGYALLDLTDKFPAGRLERLQQPLSFDQQPNFDSYFGKWMKGAAETLRDPLPHLGGNWLAALFLAGLMVQFREVGRRRLHYFTLSALLWFFLVEPLCQTQLSLLVPVVNSENLLILVMPLMLVFGAAFVTMLIDAIEWNHLLLRDLALGIVAFLVSLPLLTSLLPPRKQTIIEPLYAPGLIQTLASFMKPSEMIMSDIPWAVAWYGNCDCIRLPLQVEDPKRLKKIAESSRSLPEDFFEINDRQRSVNALYLSPFTSEVSLRRLLENDADSAWGTFYLEVLLRRNAGNVPLKNTYPNSAKSGHLFLSDFVRW